MLATLDPRTWDLRRRLHAVALLVILIGAVAHNVALFHWYVEDAAIDFGFADNIVRGYGAVVQPGMERLEGYSNPTWVAVLVIVRAFGADLMLATHWVQLVICLITIPVVYGTGREVFGRRSELPLVPPAFLACSSQFAIWGQAGLENGLWNLLFALGIWRMARECRDEESGRRFPWSAVPWLLISLTRPEGIVYAAIAGFCHLLWHVVERRTLVASIQWMLLFFVPWGVYQYVHLLYFAWPFPNTYYAKMNTKELSSWDWNVRTWNWTRNFFLEMGQAFYLPVWLLGVLGHPGVRGVVAGSVFAALAMMLELSDNQRHLPLAVLASLWFLFAMGLRGVDPRPSRKLLGAGGLIAGGLFLASEALRYYGHVPNEVPVASWMEWIPPYVLVPMAAVLPAFAFGLPRWWLRALVWWTCWAAVGFAVYSEGDWMKGYRWYAMATIPASFLFTWGLDSFARWFDDLLAIEGRDERLWTPLATAVVVLGVLGQLPANVRQTWITAETPDPSPRGIKPRIDYVKRVMDRISYWEPIASVDVDMGAHLLWTDWRMLDLAGLVDIPWAHHKYEKVFMQEYLFQEMKPPYIHVHGGWATNIHINQHPEFKRDYYEIPGFPAGQKQFHIGNYLRRDLVVRPGARPEDTGVLLEEGVVVYPPEVPAEPGASRKFMVYVGMRNSLVDTHKKKTDDEFRVWMFASQNSLVQKVWDVAPGWDWMPPRDWRSDDQFVGPFTLPTGKLAAGTYDLGYVVVWEDGRVLAPAEGAPIPDGVRVGGRDIQAAFARGEIVFPNALTVLTADDRAERAKTERIAAVAAADAGQCEAAEAHWTKGRQHRPGDKKWVEDFLPSVSRALSSCWARSSDGQERPEQVRRLLLAKRWDFEAPDFVARASVVAGELQAEGDAAFALQDYETAYRASVDAVEIDGTRSWARRTAELARAFRLGIDPESLAARPQPIATAPAKRQRKSTVIGKDHKFVRPPPKPAPTDAEAERDEQAEGPR